MVNLAHADRRAAIGAAGGLLLALACTTAGCRRMPTPKELAAFHAAGPARPAAHPNDILQARSPRGPYRLVPGDLLELQVDVAAAPSPAEAKAPAATASPGPYRVVPGDILQFHLPPAARDVRQAASQATAAYECRVSPGGKVVLPTAGAIQAAGKSLAEIESAAVEAYFPKYLRRRPAVVVRVLEHRTATVSVLGAVSKPGAYELRGDQMALLPLLTQAGGIAPQGAAGVRIRGPRRAEPLAVPVHARTIPAANPRLQEGDVVEVQPWRFTDRACACRVSDAGTIQVPVVGPVQVAGKTLPEVEAAIADAFHPEHTPSPPAVVVAVAEHRTATVSVVGAVEAPGQYELRSDEASLVPLLMKAGGIVSDGARVIRIRRREGPEDEETLTLPVKDLNVPLADVPLRDGDAVEVGRRAPQFFTVVGLVNRPGTFDYPPGARYTLQQALAFSAGIEPVAEPPYAKIYRRDGDGRIVTARFKLGGIALSDAPNVPIKPGDVIALEHTFGTRTRLFFRNIFRVGVHASYPIGR